MEFWVTYYAFYVVRVRNAITFLTNKEIANAKILFDTSVSGLKGWTERKKVKGGSR